MLKKYAMNLKTEKFLQCKNKITILKIKIFFITFLFIFQHYKTIFCDDIYLTWRKKCRIIKYSITVVNIISCFQFYNIIGKKNIYTGITLSMYLQIPKLYVKHRIFLSAPEYLTYLVFVVILAIKFFSTMFLLFFSQFLCQNK